MSKAPSAPLTLTDALADWHWAPTVTQREIDNAITNLRADGIDDATIARAVAARDQYPRGMADRARALHTEQNPRSERQAAQQKRRPDCAACDNLGFVFVERNTVKPCPDCHPLGKTAVPNPEGHTR
jgi:hypothetical protein